MEKFAKPEEIQKAHSILLQDKPAFEQDKIQIIESNESCDVRACPGSGKTTTLLAKLIVLANRMPLPNNQGICVLTHTNVAIDEIKNKLGPQADVLFKYPNHFGTIQSFVDKYLAIPALKKYHNTDLRIMDNDITNKYMLSSFHNKDKYKDKLHTYLYIKLYTNCNLVSNEEILEWERQSGDKSIKQQLISKGILIEKGKSTKKVYLDSKKSNKGELIKSVGDRNICEIIYNKKKTICNDIDNEKDKLITNLRVDYIKRLIYSDSFQFNIQCEAGQSFMSLKEEYLNKGIMSYSDAYSLALRYCYENNDRLLNAFSSRFKYVFIDEMQDTDRHQLDVIYSIFGLDKTIIQCFGDHHQAIFNKINSDELWQPAKALEINGSKRFGENIAKVLRSVCIEKNDMLVANPEIDSLAPVLIIYDNPLNVLPKFCEIIQTKKIGSQTIFEKSKEQKNKIKAIGWAGNSEDVNRSTANLTIKSYLPAFNKNIRKKESKNYDSLKSFLRKQNSFCIKDYSNNIIEAMLHLLSLAGKKYSDGKTAKNYTKTSFQKYFIEKAIEEFNSFNSNLAKWAKNIHNSEGFSDTTVSEVKSFITSKFCEIFEIDSSNKDISQFINNNPPDIPTDEEMKSNNVFKYNGMEVEVGTIHSVKGETHAATLYLETSYYGEHESQRIMDQLKGNYYIPSKKGDKRIKETLKMAHVGMSRPKYFLCMAIHRDRYDDALDVNNGGMWEIINA